ncbi:MAG: hypothetical protein AAF959_01980 [Cyanobacteria bacterium P01_D01_bin.56]
MRYSQVVLSSIYIIFSALGISNSASAQEWQPAVTAPRRLLEIVDLEETYLSQESIFENSQVLTLQPEGQLFPLYVIDFNDPFYCGTRGCTHVGYIAHGNGYRSVFNILSGSDFRPLNQFENGFACLAFPFYSGAEMSCYNGLKYGSDADYSFSSELPANEIKTYHNEEYGFLFEIPANRRAMLMPQGYIDVIDQEEYEWRQELFSSSRGGDYGRSLVSVSVTPVTAVNSSLVDLVLEQNPYANRQFQNISIDGQSAVSNDSYNTLDDWSLTNVYVLTPDGRHLVHLSGPSSGAELSIALSTFTFD